MYTTETDSVLIFVIYAYKYGVMSSSDFAPSKWLSGWTCSELYKNYIVIVQLHRDREKAKNNTAIDELMRDEVILMLDPRLAVCGWRIYTYRRVTVVEI